MGRFRLEGTDSSTFYHEDADLLSVEPLGDKWAKGLQRSRERGGDLPAPPPLPGENVEAKKEDKKTTT